jgi:SOS-response transcriptional repressor LexA
MTPTAQRIHTYLAAHPGASIRELQRGRGLSSTSVVARHLKTLAASGASVAVGETRSARRWRVVEHDALRAAVELALQRVEIVGSYAVVPRAAIEAMRAAL